MNEQSANHSIDRLNTLPLPWSLRLLRQLPLPHKLGILERLYGRVLGGKGIRWVSCANGRTWKLDLSDSTQRWCVFGDYEGSVQMDWIRSWLADGGDVVDSGASVGQMVMYFGSMPGVTVHAFEPTEGSREWLSECVRENHFESVHILPYGLSDKTEQREILSLGSRSTLRLESYAGLCRSREVIELIRLDDYLREHSISRLRFWKLDVECHEPAALAGAVLALEAQAIDAILIEVSDSTFDAVKGQLSSAGYQLWQLSRQGWSRLEYLPRPGTYNLVAFPKSVTRP